MSFGALIKSKEHISRILERVKQDWLRRATAVMELINGSSDINK